MELKPGYKLTEAGVIPKDWDARTIGDCMRLVNGRAFKPADWKERGLPIIRIQNLNDADAPFNYFTGSVEERNRIQFGDLLFAWSGTTGTSFGARIWKGPVGVLNQHIFKVIPDQTKLTHDFAFLALQKVQEAIEKQAHGFKASFVHVKKSDLVGVELPIPPTKSEQRAIIAALSDVDTLLAKLDQLISKKRDLKQAVMQQLLTGQSRLQGFDGDWAYAKLCQVADISPGINKPISAMGSGVLYVTVQDLYKGRSIPVDQLGRIQVSTSELHSHALAPGDIVFGKSSVKRAGIGYPNIYLGAPEPAVCTGFSYRVRALSKVADAHFIFYALRWEPTRKWVIDNSQASALTNINKRIADSIPIPMPPLSEQIAIATVLTGMGAELAAVEARREKTQAIKHGMMQELLTGRTRLV